MQQRPHRDPLPRLCGATLLALAAPACGPELVKADRGPTDSRDSADPVTRRSGVLDLAEADAKLIGAAQDGAGAAVAGAGDVDADGHDDLLIGAPSGGTLSEGRVYVLTRESAGATSLTLAQATLLGVAEVDHAGQSVSGCGDLDGDGFADVMTGAYNATDDAYQQGAVYFVHGPMVGESSLADADARRLGESESDRAGSAIAYAQDVDGDGLSDVLLGVGGQDEGGEAAGAAYLVRSPVTGDASLETAHAKLIGEAEGDAAGSVSSAGDQDGDGLADLLVGAYRHDAVEPYVGAAYVVSGEVEGRFSLGDADAVLIGEDDGDAAGSGVANAHDLNEDGHDDLLIAAYHRGPERTAVGGAYVLLGPVSGTRSLADADAILDNDLDGGYAGWSIDGPGDVDADGRADLLVGSPFEGTGGLNAGAVSLFYGPLTGTIPFSQAEFRLIGEDAADNAGEAVAGAGDIDADGRMDLITGAIWNDQVHDFPGAAYLILGDT